MSSGVLSFIFVVVQWGTEKTGLNFRTLPTNQIPPAVTLAILHHASLITSKFNQHCNIIFGHVMIQLSGPTCTHIHNYSRFTCYWMLHQNHSHMVCSQLGHYWAPSIQAAGTQSDKHTIFNPLLHSSVICEELVQWIKSYTILCHSNCSGQSCNDTISLNVAPGFKICDGDLSAQETIIIHFIRKMLRGDTQSDKPG